MTDDKSEHVSIVIRRRDGTLTPVYTTEEAAVTEDDGTLRHRKTEIRQETENGIILRPGENAYTCTTCDDGKLWSKNAIRICATCASIVCLQCTKTTPKGDECKPCAEKAEKKALREFFLNPFSS